MTPAEAQELADRLVERARPGEQLEALVSWSRGTEVRAHMGHVEQLVSADEFAVGVRVIADGRQGLSWAAVTDSSELDRCVADARDNATFGTPDPNAGLAEPDGVALPVLDLVDPFLASVPTSRKVDLALELDAAIMSADPRMVGHEGADYADEEAVSAISTTTGVRAAEADTSAYLGTYALAAEGSETTTGFGMSVGRGIDSLDLAEAVEEACERALSMLGASKTPSRRSTVVFDPYVCSQFLAVVSEMLSGDVVERGRSPFADRVGEAIASPLLTLVDDPLNLDAPTASGVDGEGLACRPLTLVDGGVLSGFMHNSYTARCMSTQGTGSALRSGYQSPPGVGAKVFGALPGSRDLSGILKSVGDGLLVREIAGMHSGVNPVSGDLSVGVEGRMIRNGELAEPVREVTMASTLQRMLTDIIEVGSDLRYFPWESSGVSLAIGDMTISGT